MIDIIIKYRGKYYKAKKNLPFFADKCAQCPLKRTCDGHTMDAKLVGYACCVFNAGFRLLAKNTEDAQ